MSYLSTVIDNIYFVRWVAPQPEDIDPLVADVRATKAKIGGRLDYVALISPDVERPSDETRRRMNEAIDTLLESCETCQLVVEGKGFRRALLLSIGIGVFLVSRNRSRTFAHGSLEDALEKIGFDGARVSSVAEAVRKELGAPTPESVTAGTSP